VPDRGTPAPGCDAPDFPVAPVSPRPPGSSGVGVGVGVGGNGGSGGGSNGGGWATRSVSRSGSQLSLSSSRLEALGEAVLATAARRLSASSSAVRCMGLRGLLQGP